MLTGTALLLTIVSALIIGVVLGMFATRAFLHIFFMRRVQSAPNVVGIDTARVKAQTAS